MECGGKDAAIVDADADVAAAADALLWGSLPNARPDLRGRRAACTDGTTGSSAS